MKKVILAILIAAAATSAGATPILNSSNGISNANQTLTFDEHVQATGSAVTNQFADLGVVFAPALYYSGQSGFANITGKTITNFSPKVPSFSMLFSQTLNAASFAMVSNGTIWDFEALFNGASTASFAAVVNTSSNNFFGFSDLTFNEIRITSKSNDFMIMDNLATRQANVPEPGSLALFGIAALGIAAVRRRTRRAA